MAYQQQPGGDLVMLQGNPGQPQQAFMQLPPMMFQQPPQQPPQQQMMFQQSPQQPQQQFLVQAPQQFGGPPVQAAFPGDAYAPTVQPYCFHPGYPHGAANGNGKKTDANGKPKNPWYDLLGLCTKPEED